MALKFSKPFNQDLRSQMLEKGKQISLNQSGWLSMKQTWTCIDKVKIMTNVYKKENAWSI